MPYRTPPSDAPKAKEPKKPFFTAKDIKSTERKSYKDEIYENEVTIERRCYARRITSGSIGSQTTRGYGKIEYSVFVRGEKSSDGDGTAKTTEFVMPKEDLKFLLAHLRTFGDFKDFFS